MLPQPVILEMVIPIKSPALSIIQVSHTSHLSLVLFTAQQMEAAAQALYVEMIQQQVVTGWVGNDQCDCEPEVDQKWSWITGFEDCLEFRVRYKNIPQNTFWGMFV